MELNINRKVKILQIGGRMVIKDVGTKKPFRFISTESISLHMMEVKNSNASGQKM
jgi:hypothetical protein